MYLKPALTGLLRNSQAKWKRKKTANKRGNKLRKQGQLYNPVELAVHIYLSSHDGSISLD